MSASGDGKDKESGVTVPVPVPDVQSRHNSAMVGSPIRSPGSYFAIPSPIPTRRTRTWSQSEKAMQQSQLFGKVKSFCRQKGHGFLKPNDGGETLFVHISDIDGEYVPHEGDDVSYKTVRIPPKNEKLQAVHVNIIHLAPGVKHEKWPDYSSPGASPK